MCSITTFYSHRAAALRASDKLGCTEGRGFGISEGIVERLVLGGCCWRGELNRLERQGPKGRNS